MIDEKAGLPGKRLQSLIRERCHDEHVLKVWPVPPRFALEGLTYAETRSVTKGRSATRRFFA